MQGKRRGKKGRKREEKRRRMKLEFRMGECFQVEEESNSSFHI